MLWCIRIFLVLPLLLNLGCNSSFGIKVSKTEEDDGGTRPADGSEGIPGYLTNPDSIFVSVNEGTITISGDPGTIGNPGEGNGTLVCINTVDSSGSVRIITSTEENEDGSFVATFPVTELNSEESIVINVAASCETIGEPLNSDGQLVVLDITDEIQEIKKVLDEKDESGETTEVVETVTNTGDPPTVSNPPTPDPPIDNTAPVPGGGGALSVDGNWNFTLNWTRATDDSNMASDYLVYFSTANNISTIEDAETNGVPYGNSMNDSTYINDINSTSITGLALNQTYYFTVIARDSAGNKSTYNSVSATTSLTIRPGIAEVDTSPVLSQNGNMSIGAIMRIGDKLVFHGETLELGMEPYVYDTVTESYSLLTGGELFPGTSFNGPVQFASTGSFGAFRDNNSNSIYVTDGTPTGTQVLVDLTAGPDIIGGIFPWQGSIYFGGWNGASYGIYKSDGTGPGTIRLITTDGNPLFFAEGPPGNLNFQTDTGNIGKTDGTIPGSAMVFTANVGTEFPYSMGDCLGGLCNLPDSKASVAYVDGHFWFSADDGVNGVELWKSDGTAPGTVRVPGYGAKFLTPVGNKLIFVSGGNVYSVDSGSAPQLLVTTGSSYPKAFSATPSKVYFIDDLAVYSTDGTIPGTGSPVPIPTHLGSLVGSAFGEDYFVWDSNSMWKTDGVTATFMKYIGSPREEFRESILVENDKFYFSGSGLVESDGTAAGTKSVVNPIDIRGSDLRDRVAVANDRFYVVSNDDFNGRSLINVEDTVPSTLQSFPSGTRNLGSVTEFPDIWIGPDGAGMNRLWKVSSTGSIANITPNCEARPGIAWFDDKYFFPCFDASTGLEMWTYDPLDDNSEQFVDLFPGTQDGLFYEDWAANDRIVSAGGFLYFAGSTDGDHELWRTDGTIPGTTLVRNIAPSGNSRIDSMAKLGNNIVFACWTDVAVGKEPCFSDGTMGGSGMITDVYSGGNWSLGFTTSEFVETGSTSVFKANQVTETKLFATDGAAVTELYTLDNRERTWGYFPLMHYDGLTYFSAVDGASGRELWSTDGTPGATAITADINPGIADSDVTGFHVAFGLLWFIAKDDTNNYKLWSYDPMNASPLLERFNFGPGALPTRTILGFTSRHVYISGPSSLSKYISIFRLEID